MTTWLESLRSSATLRFRTVVVLGILFCLIGSAGIILSVIELFYGRPSFYHYDESQGGLVVENPLWPSSGKGLWVGLILIATGLVGILASRERTPPSIIGFTALASVSTILSFYLTMTCIIPVQYDTKYSNQPKPSWPTIELVLNSLLTAVGGLGAIIGTLSTLFGSFLTGFFADQRQVHPNVDDVEKITIVPPERFKYGTPKLGRRELIQQSVFSEVL